MYRKEQYLTEINNEPTQEEINLLVLKIYEQVFRSKFDKPGFSHIKLCYKIEAKEFRIFTIKLVEQLNTVYFQNHNERLECISIGRYDQKETTKYHLDGGTDESYLILGYEASEIKSELSLADYSLAAFEMALSPKDFLLHHNPMFNQGEDLLKPYITGLNYFDEKKTNLLFINNSCMSFTENKASLGILHKAKVSRSLPNQTRIINSIQIGRKADNLSPLNSDLQLSSFIDLDVISRKPYEK